MTDSRNIRPGPAAAAPRRTPRRRRLFQPVCTVAGHRRSTRYAYLHPSERIWHSYCCRCRSQMKKVWPTGWLVVT